MSHCRRCLIGETDSGLWSARIAPQLLMTPTVPFSPKARINIKPWSHLLTWSSILPQVFTHTHRRECTQTSSRAGRWWKRGRLSSSHGTNKVHTGAAPTEPLIIQYTERRHNKSSWSLWAGVVFCQSMIHDTTPDLRLTRLQLKVSCAVRQRGYKHKSFSDLIKRQSLNRWLHRCSKATWRTPQGVFRSIAL